MIVVDMKRVCKGFVAYLTLITLLLAHLSNPESIYSVSSLGVLLSMTTTIAAIEFGCIPGLYFHDRSTPEALSMDR